MDTMPSGHETGSDIAPVWLYDIVSRWPEHDGDSTPCMVGPMDTSVNARIQTLIADGAQLLEYTLDFPSYDVNPLTSHISYNYKSDVWTRVTSKHGSTLLTLPFNYEVLSLRMLAFGVENLHVSLSDQPPGCFGNLSEANQINVTRSLVLRDFLPSNVSDVAFDLDDQVCHNTINQSRWGLGTFSHQCCKRQPGKDDLHCFENANETPWISLLYTLLETTRVLFFLFGPLILQAVVYHGDLRSSVPYVVHLDEEYHCNLTVRGGRRQTRENSLNPGSYTDTSRRNTDAWMLRSLQAQLAIPSLQAYGEVSPEEQRKVPFRKLKKKLEEKVMKTGIQQRVTINRLHLIVDHSKLMTQREVPLSLFHVINRNLLMCAICSRQPFKACSKVACTIGSSIQKLRCVASRRLCFWKPLTWGGLLQCIGALILLTVVIPSPFHVRVVMYFLYEAPENLAREAAIRQLGLRGPYIASFWLGPLWPNLVVMTYLVYLSTAIFIVSIRLFVYKPNLFDDIFQDCITDLRRISLRAICRGFVQQIIKPFSQFGLFLGAVMAVPYYVIILPVTCLLSLFYCVPTFYMTGRLLMNFRSQCCSRNGCDCCGNRPETTVGRRKLFSSENTFDTVFFLDRISPDNREYPRLPVHRVRPWVLRATKRGLCRLGRHVLPHLVGVACIILMLTLFVMYAESARFFLEVVTLTLMGVIANAKYALDYFMLAFWTIIYCQTCFKILRDKYAQLAVKIFDFIKDELKEKIADVTRVPEKYQTFAAFKYFTNTKIENLQTTLEKYFDTDDERDSEVDSDVTPEPEVLDPDEEPWKDKLLLDKNPGSNGYRGLIAQVNNLVLFVDRKDRPRIPKKLFWELSNHLKAPGCPGPLSNSVYDALKQLLYMILFLLFVFIIIMSFDQVSDVSSSNHLLLTVASGFLPVVIRFVMMPKGARVDLSDYSLKGKIEEILLHYRQTWQVYDLALDNCTGIDSYLSETSIRRKSDAAKAAADGDPREESRVKIVTEVGESHEEVEEIITPDINPITGGLDFFPSFSGDGASSVHLCKRQQSVRRENSAGKPEDREKIFIGDLVLDYPDFTRSFRTSTFSFEDGPVLNYVQYPTGFSQNREGSIVIGMEDLAPSV